jgi:hypothetical protein
MNPDTPLPVPMKADPNQPRAVQKYLEVMKQVDRNDQYTIYWWTRMNEEELMQVMQSSVGIIVLIIILSTGVSFYVVKTSQVSGRIPHNEYIL